MILTVTGLPLLSPSGVELAVGNLLLFGTLIALVGSGLMAGLFFVFSNFVMRALAELPTQSGIAAMQGINEKIMNPTFLFVFLATPAACLVVLGLAFALPMDSVLAANLIAGSLCYLVGGLVVTAAFNVPLNNALARRDPKAPEAQAEWEHYQRVWTRWNHLRTIACVLATALLAYALPGIY